jgi:thiol-disulfide isomerase/thioredoxin
LVSSSIRWTIAALIVAVAVVAALLLELVHTGPKAGPPTLADRDLAALRQRADLPPCPPDGPGPGPQLVRGVTVECLSDGAPVDIARALSGKTVLLNLWAYWCAPCAQELPAMAAYQQRVGSAVTVITVHEADNAAAALSRLAELGVRLPTWQDSDRRVAAALSVPNVMPASVVLRSDGTVAANLPQSFVSADEIAAAVDEKLGAPR